MSRDIVRAAILCCPHCRNSKRARGSACAYARAMATVIPVRILPAILRIFAPVRTLPIRRGVAIPLNDISPMNDAEALRALNRKLQVKKKPEFNDNSHVIKVSDVRTIVEKVLGEGHGVVSVASKIGVALITGDPGPPVMEDAANEILKQVRNKVLKQTEVRRRITYRYSKRAI